MEKVLSYKDYDNFFKWLFNSPQYIMYESDFIIKSDSNSGIIHYPVSFYELIKTKPMIALGRKLQLSLKTLTFNNYTHTRLEHSKGTYYRLLRIIIDLYEESEMRHLFEQDNNKELLIAYLVKALFHDVGHGPLSHTFETIVGGKHELHEQIGSRIINENIEVRTILEKINPGLPELIQTIEKDDPLGLSKVLEGQSDVDRDDFMIRDNFYIGSGIDANSIESKYKGFTLREINGSINPVYIRESMPHIEAFLSNRFYNYKDVYLNTRSRIHDYIYQMFGQQLESVYEYYHLKHFLSTVRNKDAKDIDIDEFIKWDDLEYFTKLFDIYLNTKDPILKELGLLSIPNANAMDNILQGLMVSREQNDDIAHIEYYNKIKHFQRLYHKYPEFNQDNSHLITTLETEDEVIHNYIDQEINSMFGRLRLGFVHDKSPIKMYKKKEPIYIIGPNNKIFEYSEHPERTLNPDMSYIKHCTFLLPDILLHQGYSKKDVNKAIQLIKKSR